MCNQTKPLWRHIKRHFLFFCSYHKQELEVCSLSRSRCYEGWAELCVFSLRVCPEPDPSTTPELLASSWSSADRLLRKRCSGAAGATEPEWLLLCCFYYFYCSPEATGETESAAGSCSESGKQEKTGFWVSFYMTNYYNKNMIAEFNQEVRRLIVRRFNQIAGSSTIILNKKKIHTLGFILFWDL